MVSPSSKSARNSRLLAMSRQAALTVPRLRRLVDQRDALLEDRAHLVDERNALQEQSRRLANERDRLLTSLEIQSSPFIHYNAVFDPQEVVRRHAASNVQATPKYLTNYLGVRIDPKFFPSLLEGRAGKLEGIPIPANWHADVAEWGAALRAVDLAQDSFTVVELGCGWGCWMNNTGVAARRAGLNVHLIGVEGDAKHFQFAVEAWRVNGFASHEVTLHHGIAGASNGIALFPRQQQAEDHWGLQPILGATEEQRQHAMTSGSYDELPVIPLAELAPSRVDLLHLDIQGGETELLAGCLDVLNANVAYVVVGTHSRQIEGRIMDTLLAAEWKLEIERPAILSVHAGVPQVTVDGVQGWRNPRLDREQRR